MIRLAVLTFAAFLVFSGPAAADPISALASIGAAIKASTILTAIAQFSLSAGLSLAAQKLRGKPKEPGLQNSFKGRGATQPATTVLGRAATTGHWVYHNSHDFNNQRYHEVIELGDLPGATLQRLIIDGEYSALGALNADWGYVVSSKDRPDGAQPHRVWIRHYDGNQTVADGTLVQHFANDPDRPWTNAHILKGKPVAMLHYEFDRKAFSRGVPELRFEVLGPPMYNPRKDSSVGGSGTHRWNNKATWEQTENLVQIIYNIMRGIDLPGGNVWGGRCDAEDLPLSSWVAAMNACDVTVSGRPKYRGGIEVDFTQPPRDYINELLAGCAGQMVELGGVWRIQVDAPATAVASLTDDDMSVSHTATKDPFPGLEGTFNAVTVTHPDPAALWNGRPAETITNATWEAEDGTRRVFDLKLPAVPYAEQAKQVANMMAKDNRRFRRHQRVLPPDYFFIEALQTLSWTSADEGYSAKLFEIAEAAYDPFTFNVHISVRERDPADFTPDLSLEVGSAPVVTTPITRVDAGVPGFDFNGISIDDDTGPRRPGFELVWTPDALERTATALAYEVRVASTETVVASGTTVNLGEGRQVLSGDFLPGVTYEARPKALSLYRDAVWGDWVSAVAPAVSDQVRVVQLTSAAQAFEYNASGQSPAPATAVLTATARNALGTPWYEFLVAGVSKQNSIAATYTYTPPASIVDMPELITVRLREGASDNPVLSEDYLSTFGLRAGGTVLQGSLSNQTHNVPADANGSSAVMTGSGTTVEIFFGATRLTYNGSGTSPGTYTVTRAAHAGSITPGAVSLSGGNAVIGNHSNMNTNVAVVRMTVTGRDSSGVAFSMTLDQSISKVLAGAAGAPGVSAMNVHIDNPAVTLPANSNGTVQSYIGSGCTLEVLQGSTFLQFTRNTSLSIGQWRITSTPVFPASNDITVGSIIDSGHEATIGAHSSMDANEASVSISYNIQARTLDGTYVNLVAKQSIGKAIEGLDGVGIASVSKSGQTVTVTYDDSSSDSFTVNGVASAQKSGNVLTLTYDDGSTNTLTDGQNGQPGKGISSIAKSGETVTITFDDASTSQFTVPNGTAGQNAITGRIEFLTVSNITKASDGTYSATSLEFDAIFEQGGTVVARDRYRVNRSGDTWNTLIDITGGTQINTNRVSESGGLSVNGQNATCKITYSWGGVTSTVSASVSIVKDGLGITSIDKTGDTVTISYDDNSTDTFTVNGVANVAKVNGVLTITYDDGTNDTLIDGDPGVGITNVTRAGDVVTVSFDDGGTSTFTIVDGEDATYGDPDPVTSFTITKSALGTYSATYLDVDFEFRKSGNIVARDRFRATRLGDTWSTSATKPTGGSGVNPNRLSGAVTRSGATAVLTVTDSNTSARASVALTIVADGVPGVAAVYGSAEPVTTFTIVQASDGSYDASSLDVDVTFLQDGAVIAADRYRVTRIGSGWSSSILNPSGGTNTNTSNMSRSLSRNGATAVLKVTHTNSGAVISVPLNIISNGVDGADPDTPDTPDVVFTGRVYFQTLRATAIAAPVGSSFNVSTGQFAQLTTGWAYDAPDVAATDTSVKMWTSRYTVIIDGETGVQTITFTPPTGAIIFANDIQSDGYNGGGNAANPGTDGFFISRSGDYAEFGAAAIRDLISAGQIKLDDLVLDTDASGNLTITQGGVTTNLLGANAASIPMQSATGSVLTGNTGGGGYQSSAQITVNTTDVEQVSIEWDFEQAYSAGDGPNWGYRLRRGSSTLKFRTNMFFGIDQAGGTFIDAAPLSGNQTYYLDWWSTNDATITAQGTISISGGRKV